MAVLLRFILLLCCVLGACPAWSVQEVSPQELPANDPGLYQAWMSAGRKSFQERRFAESLIQYRKALELRPDDAYTRLVTGVAAYWARDPESALEYFNALAARTGTGLPEKDLTLQRVLALSALGKEKELAPLLARLEEINAAELAAGLKAPEGFTREHVYEGTVRAGIWQRYPGKDGVRSWQISVVDTKGPQDQPLLKLNLVPDKTGAVLRDDTGRRIYRRWQVLPSYSDVRETVQALLLGKLQPQIDSAIGIEPNAVAPAANGVSPAVERMLVTAKRLADVDFDMTRSVRFSVSDPEKAKRMEEKDLQDKFPNAPNDAAEMVRYVARSSPEDFAAAFQKLPPILDASKGGYLRFALLTGLSARGGEFPQTFLLDCLGQHDFIVRETAAVLVARSGKRDGLEVLIKELQDADPISARILSFALEEVLGVVLGACPPATDERAVAKWKNNALEWWKNNQAKLNFYTARGALQPPWRENP